MSLIAGEDFQHILRLLNTNVDGKQKIMFALTSIKGVGRRFANIACKKADIDMNKRAGELSAEELERLMTVVANPRQFKVPDWFLNRKKDYKDGRFSQVVSNALDMKLRDDLERLKKIRNHRGLRHYWGLRVRGQHTKTTGRRGKTVGEYFGIMESYGRRVLRSLRCFIPISKCKFFRCGCGAAAAHHHQDKNFQVRL
ncbi:hypothetical protein GUJ93_ZPchr0013g34529 [Zizania palustris]|uniref:40S ribosomal protein S18 n=1 Tax=Zizania palustris TaxID=103762 RepID=A0A8J5WZE1_ZIZPA|nr:hypothetical protein GUJ93_ZPchr0013g34529 [Zizania palustris]